MVEGPSAQLFSCQQHVASFGYRFCHLWHIVWLVDWYKGCDPKLGNLPISVSPTVLTWQPVCAPKHAICYTHIFVYMQ